MDGSLFGSSEVLAFAMGLTAFVGLLHVRLGRGGGERMHVWVAIWCLFTLAFQAARFVQLEAQEAETAVQAVRVYYGTGWMLVASVACLVRALVGSLTPRVAWGSMLGAGVVATAAIGTDLFVAGATTTHTDWFGRPFIAAPITNLALLLAPAIVLASLDVGLQLARSRLRREERRILLLAVGSYSLLGVLSVASATHRVEIPSTIEFGPLVLALAMNELLMGRHLRLRNALEHSVAERTAEIQTARVRLEESEARHRELVERAPVGVFSCDTRGHLETLNPVALEMLGAPSAATALGLNALTHPSAQASGIAHSLSACMTGGRAVQLESTFLSPFGPTTPFRLTAAPVRDASGAIRGALGILQDVGEQRELERRLLQARKMESVGQLAAGIAHEINNPMSYVRTNLGLLRSEWEQVSSRLKDRSDIALAQHVIDCEDLIDESLQGVDRTIEIVRDMQEFTRTTRGEREMVDLGVLVATALRMASQHGGPGIEVEEHYGNLPTVSCAGGPMRQVVLNLIVNAFQALGESGTVRVETYVDGAMAVIAVEDDGSGIDPEHRPRLFDPFFTTKEAGSGTGLGLYVSYEIVHGHGGEIDVYSEPGQGARFEVRLPLFLGAGATDEESTGEGDETPEP